MQESLVQHQVQQTFAFYRYDPATWSPYNFMVYPKVSQQIQNSWK